MYKIKISHKNRTALIFFCMFVLVLCLLLLFYFRLQSVTPVNPKKTTEVNLIDHRPIQKNENKTKISEKRNQDNIPENETEKVVESRHSIGDGVIKKGDKIITKNGQEFPLRQYKAMIAPNDPLANQWWVDPNGMNQVWDIPYGTRPSKIAIIDTGFALEHQEFNGRWAVNGGESGVVTSQGPSKLNCTSQGVALNKSCNNIDDDFDRIVDNESGPTTRQNPSRLNCSDQNLPLNKACNRIDDENNQLIDDYRGWDFSNFDSIVQAGETNPDGDGTTHGTMTAGVLAANGNNSVGIAGVDWYSNILPIQALNDDSMGDSYTVGEAIYYAADQKADIINISLGTNAEDPYLRLAIQYAMERGAIIVAASGNDGCNCISYPANYPEVVAVGAISSSGNPANFSSFGRQLDVLAPGSNIISSFWTKTNQSSAYVSGVAGTSFSTPFVAGLLGLGKSYQADASWEEILGAMLENSDRRTLTDAIPRSDQLGYGVTRANTMLNRLITPAKPSLRYQLGGTFSLGSQRTYKCEDTFPTTLQHELTKTSMVRYTASEFENHKAIQQGWTSQEAFYSCIGLPSDKATVLRTINLPAELRNENTKLQTP